MKFGTVLSHGEKIQKRALRIIYLEQTYKDALLLAGITKLETRREDLCLKTFTKITRAGPLTQYVTQTRSSQHNYFIRSLNNLSTYKCRTDRFKNSFFPNTIKIANSKQCW